MPRFIMAVGIAGSGKSYLYDHVYSIAAYVSSDKIREEVFGDVNDQSHNGEVFNIMLQRTREFLKSGADVYYDATNINAKRRINLLKEIASIPDVVKICALNVPPIEVVRERNASRERKVPEYVIERMFKNFEIPHKSEGWDSIEIYGCDNNVKELVKIITAANKIPHDNHHHSETIGEHMRLASRYVVNKMSSSEDGINRNALKSAALFHDIGKPYCKVFHDAHNNPTEEAHYYNHENVGSYIYLSHSFGLPHDLYVANLILHHMDHYKQGYIEKLAKRFDKDFINDLAILNEADKATH